MAYRKHAGGMFFAKAKPTMFPWWALCRRYLFSQSVTQQVSSAAASLTSVFGMGTGGPSPQSAPTAAVPSGTTGQSKTHLAVGFVLALRIFPVSHPTSIVRADELNFCVRDGNRWTLIAINTNFVEAQVCFSHEFARKFAQPQLGFSSPKRTGSFWFRNDVP